MAEKKILIVCDRAAKAAMVRRTTGLDAIGWGDALAGNRYDAIICCVRPLDLDAGAARDAFMDWVEEVLSLKLPPGERVTFL